MEIVLAIVSDPSRRDRSVHGSCLELFGALDGSERVSQVDLCLVARDPERGPRPSPVRASLDLFDLLAVLRQAAANFGGGVCGVVVGVTTRDFGITSRIGKWWMQNTHVPDARVGRDFPRIVVAFRPKEEHHGLTT